MGTNLAVHERRRRWTDRATTMGRRLGWFGVVLGLGAACKPAPTNPFERAEFGVLFGGQIQERTEIPFELDSSKQTLGFVVQLRQPLSAPTSLHWELSKPGPLAANRVSDPLSRRVELFDAPLGAGQTQIQKTVNLEPGDGLGMWNIRVTVGDQLAIDRAFMVFDPATRARKVRAPTVVDAGL